MDMTFEEMIAFAKKHHIVPKEPLDIKPDTRWLGQGYNIAANVWNKKHPEDPVELMPD